MHDGVKAAIKNLPARLLHEDDKPLFLLNGRPMSFPVRRAIEASGRSITDHPMRNTEAIS